MTDPAGGREAEIEAVAQRLIESYSYFEPSDNDMAWRVARTARAALDEFRSSGSAGRNLRDALQAIAGPSDSGPWIFAYREAGGGYEGLQAIARTALQVCSQKRRSCGWPECGGDPCDGCPYLWRDWKARAERAEAADSPQSEDHD